MTAFKHTSIDKNGRKSKGVIDADNARHARQLLRDRMLVPIQLDATSPAAPHHEHKKTTQKSSRIKLRDLGTITRQMAMLIQSGITVEQALKVTSNQNQTPSVVYVLSAVRSLVLEGNSLTASLTKFPSSFSDIYLTSVEAGERTGHLDKVLLHLADFIEKSHQARQKILLALLYPAILSVVSLLIIIFMLTYIIPNMIRVFADAGHALPFLTRALIVISHFLQEYGIFLLAGALVMVWLARKLFTLPHIRLHCDTYVIRTPLLGRLVLEYNCSRYASTLGMLQDSGVPLTQGLEIVTAITHNQLLRMQAGIVSRKVREGSSLSKALEQNNSFLPILSTMAASGEASGKLGEMLVRTGTMLQRDAENRIAFILGLFEPTVLLVMGGMVLLLVLAIILPILSLNQLV